MDRGIQPLLRGKRIAAAAVTLAIPGQDSTLLHRTLGLLWRGDILVVDRLGDDKHACWGGGIIDGPCTDLTEIEGSDFPMWCRGMSPITTRLYNLGRTINLPISCGNVPVKAGDAILADESGVLVLPRDEAEAIAAAAIGRQERGERRQELKAGEKLGDISGAIKMVSDALKQNH
ncbi:RraA family protein [Bosea vestrisii]|uniref:RraA family protein n=1 Tax=Bosea vestrisii TaxID=151416 RepID=UPI0024DF3E62|nr:RraA family protein [Bosea vestrisii]WID97165.1 RraA family protein [Bosea vestrisii]